MVSHYFLGITSQVFFDSIRSFFELGDLLGGLAKGALFGMMISLIGCYQGLETSGGTQGVGKSTIASFVMAAVAILTGDFLLWIILF